MAHRVIIIDDEKPARDLLRNYLSKHADFEVIEEADNGFDGCKKIGDLRPDLVFLDIQMPKISGLEMLELLEEPMPYVIFSTAFDHYAVKAFERNALDYLLKPYTYDRFSIALERYITQTEKQPIGKLRESLNESDHAGYESLSRIPVKYGSRVIIIKIEDIMYFEAQDDYVRIVTAGGKYLRQSTMKYFQDRLPEDAFIRIHRSFLANINYIKQLETYENYSHAVILNDSTRLPVSRSGSAAIKKHLNM